MKATGIVRKLDVLGRIVIPMELRKTFDLQINDPIEIFMDGGDIILRKYQPSCIFCGEANEVQQIRGKNVCKACLQDIQSR